MGFGDFLFKKKDEKPVMLVDALKSTAPVYKAPTMYTQAGKTDYIKHLDDLMNNSNLPGPDYYEFSKGISKMSDAPLTEGMKFKTVFGNFEIMGLTIDKLNETATKYIDILDKEKADFDQQALETKNTDVVAKQEKIERSQQEIIALNNKIQETQASIQVMTVEKQKSENELTVECNNFDNAYNLKKEVITSDIQKIKTYLNETK